MCKREMVIKVKPLATASTIFACNPGDRSGSMRGFPGAMNNFGQWEGPGSNRGRGVSVEHHLVPANKTGLVIGKGKICCHWTGCAVVKASWFYPGGDTIKQINMQSGAHAEIEKNPPPGADLNYKTFIIKGLLIFCMILQFLTQYCWSFVRL